jgi:hypothetical protein
MYVLYNKFITNKSGLFSNVLFFSNAFDVNSFVSFKNFIPDTYIDL